MKEYKGIGGSKITIDGDRLSIKNMFIKEDCTAADIVSFNQTSPNPYRHSVGIVTRNGQAPYAIIFKNAEAAQELVDALKQIAPDVYAADISAFAQSADTQSVPADVPAPAVDPDNPNLVICPDCGGKVSKAAASCVHCGRPMGAVVPVPVAQAVPDENEARCPKCGSTSLSANKKGFGVGKAVVGAALTGGIGLMAGNIGAKKVRITCMKCGHQFWAGKG